jgi:integrase
VADIIKTYAKRIGLDPKSVGGHGLRAGFLTSAAARGASIFKMMDVSRHRSVDTLQGYVRDADRFRRIALILWPPRAMSAFGGKADMLISERDVCF